MKKIIAVTGADGHLGNTILRLLARNADKDTELRAFVHEKNNAEKAIQDIKAHLVRGGDSVNAKFIAGDVRKPASLRPLFEHAPDVPLYVIHCAGIVDISNKVSQLLYDTNVNGTKNIIAFCREAGVDRLVYVSSVHAIPEGDRLSVIREAARFSPDLVTGGYAKTKAEATQAVLDAAHDGLDAVVVHPSGILGPYDTSGNHLVQMVTDYIHGKLPAGVKGGYDFVDVRDVAKGCVAALEEGSAGECYILSGRHYTIAEILAMVRRNVKVRRVPILPLWLAKAFAPAAGLVARLSHTRPLYTAYSLYTIQTNDRFSHEKATLELGYTTRDMQDTIRDTVAWANGKL